MIIRSWLVAVCASSLVPVAAAAQHPTPDGGIACVSCLILHVPAQAAASLDVPAGALEGLTIAVDGDHPLAAEALARIGAAGAESAVTTAASAQPPADVLRRASIVIVRDVSDADQPVFDVRILSTAARSARPGIRVLVEGSAIPGRLQPYVDGRIDPGPTVTDSAASRLTEISRQGGAAPTLVTLTAVDWSAISKFAADRAIATEVVATGALTADQIVARHQAQRRRQDHLVRRTIARGTTTVLFEVPGFAAPVTVTAETIVYRQPDLVELEQRSIRVNGAAIAGGSATSPPQLPLIEPERVATPPLVITLNDEYAYSLAGVERDGPMESYVVRFEPRGAANAHGRVWIDAVTFALRRLETVQTGLHGPIVSSEQHETYTPFTLGEERVWLPTRVNVYQRYEGAGHRTPIHRTIETPEYDINPSDFDARLHAAYASPHVMLRETPQGYRYLLRSGETGDDAAREVAPRAGERIRTAVFGILVDPNITVPLPFAGFSYVDLNLFGTGAQLNAFFGGSFGQLSWSVPSLGTTRWRAHGRAFGIAASYNDRSFRDGIERYRENITQRPAHFSAGVAHPTVFRLRARFDYELDYTAFDRSDTTGSSFLVPHDALVHGFVAAIEGESGPWSARAWWNPARRQRWTPWGDTPAGVNDEATFQRFGVSAARTLALGGAVSSRIEAAWMDGRDLDRFSRYSFGAFENRLRGYPTASIRYDRGGVLRSVTSWAGRGFRIDAFGDLAAVRDPGFGDSFRGYPGVGGAVELGGPLRTLWSVEWGYGFKARRSDGGQGTQAVRVTAYRTF